MNGSINIHYTILGVNTSVQINSTDYPLTILFLSNSSGSWLQYNSIVISVNNTVLVNNSNFSAFCSWYWWMVSAVNMSSGNVTNSSIFCFRTSCAGGFIPMMIQSRWSHALLLSLGCLCLPFLFLFWRRRKKHGIEK
jgi:hypothetical protein